MDEGIKTRNYNSSQVNRKIELQLRGKSKSKELPTDIRPNFTSHRS